MKRRGFLKNCLMGIAISLVPKVLQPVLPEIVEAEQGYIGLIPTLRQQGNVVDLTTGSFQLSDLCELIQAQDNLKRKNSFQS